MAKIQRELWRKNWLNSINELTSLELQKISWLDQENTNPHWSFIEFMCCYFDDLIIDNNYEYPLQQNWITKEEFDIIQDWHHLLDKYKSPEIDDYNHTSILKDENWLGIIRKGVKAVEELKNALSKKEVEVLSEDIYYKKTTN